MSKMMKIGNILFWITTLAVALVSWRFFALGLEQAFNGMLAHIQVNDSDRRGPGQGSDQFADIIAALKRHDYKGWIAAEPFRYEPDGPTCAAAVAGYLRGLIEAVGSK